jgi:hypothetical protein
MNRKMVSVTLMVLSAAVLVVGATPRDATAKSGCTISSLRGSYGVKGTGTVVSGPLQGPVAFVGIITFDGAGELSGSLSSRLNTATGPTTAIKGPIIGTYTVNEDCSAEDTWTNPVTGASNTHEIIIVDKGEEFLFLVTTPGSPGIVSGVGRKQFPGDSGAE